METINDDDDVQLSESAAKALQEFYNEQSKLEEELNSNKKTLVEENWLLSQFWYDKETTNQLTKEVLTLAENYLENNATGKFSIACVSCPTLYHNLYSILNDDNNNKNADNKYSRIEFKLFEYDMRFGRVYNSVNAETNELEQENFIFYDYNKPLNIDAKYKNRFHLVIADPPYIAEECMIKTSMTIRFLLYNSNDTNTKNDDCRKIIVCTGQLMKDLLEKCLNLKQCVNFEPKHERNLANEFRCYSNYEPHYL